MLRIIEIAKGAWRSPSSVSHGLGRRVDATRPCQPASHLETREKQLCMRPRIPVSCEEDDGPLRLALPCIQGSPLNGRALLPIT